MSSASTLKAAWLAWALFVVGCGVGLQWYRVDNAIDGWAPEQAPMGEARTYVVVGGPADAFSRVASELRNLPSVDRVIDPLAIALLRPLGGPTPDRLVTHDGWAGGFYFAAAGVKDEPLVDAIHDVVDREPLLRVAGPAVYQVALNTASQARMPYIAAAIAFVGLIGVRLCGFSWIVAARASGVVVGSQIALLGMMSWLGLAVDATASMAPPLMAALGYSLVLHRAGGAGVGLLVGCYATTAIAAASVAVAPVGPLRQFGLVSLGGLTLIAIGSWLLVGRGARASAMTARFGRSSQAAWLTSAVFVAAGIAMAPRLSVNGDGVALLPDASREWAAFEELDSDLTGMLPSQLVLEPPAPGIAAELETSPAITKVIDSSRLDGLPPGSRYWVLAHNAALPELEATVDRARATINASGGTLEWRGLAAQLAAAEQQVARVAVGALPTALATTAIAAWIAARSLRAALAASVAATVPSAALVVILSSFDIALTPPHLLVFAIATGVAADDLLHACRAWSTGDTGSWRRACIASSAVSVACLLPLLASPFPPARQFAWMLAVALSVASVSAVVLFPRLLPRLHGSREHA